MAPGIWNAFDPFSGSPSVLTDAITGAPSGVTISNFGANTGTQMIMDPLGVNDPLFDDFVTINGIAAVDFTGLMPDTTYSVVTHSWMNGNHGVIVETIPASTVGIVQSMQTVWPGLLPSESFVAQPVTSDMAGQLTIQFTPGPGPFAGSTTQRIAGLQLIPATGIGSRFCMAQANSTGVPAQLDVIGFIDETVEGTGMQITNLPPFSFGYPIFSPTQNPNPTILPQSCGSLCIAGPIFRWLGQGTALGGTNIFQSGAPGTVVLQRMNWNAGANAGMGNIDVDTLFNVGTTWYFQAWYRDGVADAGCNVPGNNATSNLTNGYTVTWQ